jgi:hypothetical protein
MHKRKQHIQYSYTIHYHQNVKTTLMRNITFKLLIITYKYFIPIWRILLRDVYVKIIQTIHQQSQL